MDLEIMFKTGEQPVTVLNVKNIVIETDVLVLKLDDEDLRWLLSEIEYVNIVDSKGE